MSKESKICPKCNTQLYPDSVKCFACGFNLKEQSSVIGVSNSSEVVKHSGIGVSNSPEVVKHFGNPICPNCYYELYPDSVKCFSCGYVLPKEKYYIDDVYKKYILARGSMNIPDTYKLVTYKDASVASPIRLAKNESALYVWKVEDNLNFFTYFPDDFQIYTNEEFRGFLFDSLKRQPLRDLKVSSISINQIEDFELSGEIFRENKISGGGGGGASIGGAIIGGMIAGGVGAIIGGRQKVTPIKSELITHDTRETFLKFIDANKERHTLIFGFDAYKAFNDLIPEKECSIVRTVKSSEIISSKIQTQSGNDKSVTDLIREFSKLKDEGIITQEEFDAKKKQLMGL